MRDAGGAAGAQSRAIRRATSARRRARRCSSASAAPTSYKGYGVMDLATTYNLAVWKTLRPWFKVEVYNLFNNQKQIAWDRTVTADAASAARRQRHPAPATSQGPRFGQATAGDALPAAVSGPERRPRVPRRLRRAILGSRLRPAGLQARLATGAAARVSGPHARFAPRSADGPTAPLAIRRPYSP